MNKEQKKKMVELMACKLKGHNIITYDFDPNIDSAGFCFTCMMTGTVYSSYNLTTTHLLSFLKFNKK